MHLIWLVIGAVMMAAGLAFDIKARRTPRSAKDQSEYLHWSTVGDLVMLAGLVLAYKGLR